MTGKDNRQHGGIVIEVEFEDKTRRQKLYNLTEGAPYTTKALRDIGWMGKTYKDFLKPQLVGTAVNVTLADSVDKDGNVRVDNRRQPVPRDSVHQPSEGIQARHGERGGGLGPPLRQVSPAGRPRQHGTRRQRGLGFALLDSFS